MSPPLNSPSPRRSRGFTLVEILVVVSIIVILMAILIPVAMRAISAARNAAIGVELSSLKTAMEDYKNVHGDYPPSMDWDPNFAPNVANQAQRFNAANRYSTVCERHLLRCYSKITPADKNKFYTYIAPILEQDEALVFWLCMIANDPREPFKNFVYNNNNGNIFYANGNFQNQLNFNDFPGSYTRFVHFDFDTRRLVDGDGDGIPGYNALYSRDTTYMYFDSRTYINSQPSAYAARGVAQPYSDFVAISKNQSKFMNPNTFQIVCAGQDGNFGLVVNPFTNGNFDWTKTKYFPPPTPDNIHCNEEDSDNMTDFTEGRRMIDHRAP